MAGEIATPEMRKYESLAKFYPFYLSEHGERTTRRLHFLGLMVALACLVLLVVTGNWLWLPLMFVAGYSFACIGHAFVEKNQPASFRQPLYSFMSDWRMFWELLTGKIPF